MAEAGGDGPASDLDQGASPDRATLFDMAPPDTAPSTDSATGCLASWNDWTCSTNPSNCVAICGTYKLVCNKTQCTCTDGNTINTCGSSSSTECSACQTKLGAGCCQGL